MLRDKAFRIGRIAKTHGVSGQLSVKTDLRISEPDEWPEWVFLHIDSGLVPFRANTDRMIWRDEKHLIIALEDCDDQDKARKLVGNDVWFPNEHKNDILESADSEHPLVGFTISDAASGELGEIVELIELPNNPLFKIIVEGREILIPAREEWIIELDEVEKKIVMELPEGLVDL